MKKVALIFIVAVLAPSLVLAWLALRSLRDQELVLERQQELLFQGTTDRIAEQIRTWMSEQQDYFAKRIEALTQDRGPRSLAPGFDEKIREDWPLAEVGFCVTLDGSVLAPSLLGDTNAKKFREENEPFLSNRARAEVYQNSQAATTAPLAEGQQFAQGGAGKSLDFTPAEKPRESSADVVSRKGGLEQKDASKTYRGASAKLEQAPASQSKTNQAEQQYDTLAKQKVFTRSVSPQKEPRAAETQLSSVVPSDAEFRQIISDATSGTVARFLQNKLSVIFWHRPARDPQLVFGAQLRLDRLKQRLGEHLRLDAETGNEIFVALLDDTGKPAARSSDFSPQNWKRPFVATETGEALPHWEIAAYLRDPARLTRSAATLRRAIALMIGVMLVAICAGGWLLAADVRRQLALARQKTDFVSNVSHELKTPLTSIRMFSELLAEGRVERPEKQAQYSQIIAAEASRLTRLINNVLDFARLERGEKKYDKRLARLDELVEETLAHYRPQLEANGFHVEVKTEPLRAEVDRDAIAQVLLNLLSNAEKYGGDAKRIFVAMQRRADRAEIVVCDDGLGVPSGAEAKIFEQFHRAHDALNSGIPGAGLGLTLARELARAHGGDVIYSHRDGGGSCFTISLPLV